MDSSHHPPQLQSNPKTWRHHVSDQRQQSVQWHWSLLHRPQNTQKSHLLLWDVKMCSSKRTIWEKWGQKGFEVISYNRPCRSAETGSLTIFSTMTKKTKYVALNDTKHTAHITYTSEVWFCVMLLWEVRLSPIFRYYYDVPHYVNNPQYFCLPDEEARTRWLVKNYSFGLSSSCWFTDK